MNDRDRGGSALYSRLNRVMARIGAKALIVSFGHASKMAVLRNCGNLEANLYLSKRDCHEESAIVKLLREHGAVLNLSSVEILYRRRPIKYIAGISFRDTSDFIGCIDALASRFRGAQAPAFQTKVPQPAFRLEYSIP
jgi:hypothetical protein